MLGPDDFGGCQSASDIFKAFHHCWEIAPLGGEAMPCLSCHAVLATAAYVCGHITPVFGQIQFTSVTRDRGHPSRWNKNGGLQVPFQPDPKSAVDINLWRHSVSCRSLHVENSFYKNAVLQRHDQKQCTRIMGVKLLKVDGDILTPASLLPQYGPRFKHHFFPQLAVEMIPGR